MEFQQLGEYQLKYILFLGFNYDIKPAGRGTEVSRYSDGMQAARASNLP
jgi:hypothetical protein